MPPEVGASPNTDTWWIISTLAYLGLAILTLIPLLVSMMKEVSKLHPGGAGFDESAYFSPDANLLLHPQRLGEDVD